MHFLFKPTDSKCVQQQAALYQVDCLFKISGIVPNRVININLLKKKVRPKKKSGNLSAFNYYLYY